MMENTSSMLDSAPAMPITGDEETLEKHGNDSHIYTRLARVLARDYRYLYYVNLDTDAYIEFLTGEDEGAEMRRGEKFFDQCKIKAQDYLHPDDRDAFIRAMNRETLLDVLERNRTYVMTFRLLTETGAAYVTMKVSRLGANEPFLIVGIADNDEQIKQQQVAERAQEERMAYTRLSALVGEFICVFIVNPETGSYRQFSSTAGFKNYSRAGEGKDFFDTSIKARQKSIYPDDLELFLSVFTKENVLEEVRRRGLFSLTYRLMIDDKPNYVQIRAAMVEEPEGQRLVVGINDIDDQVRQETEYENRLAQAQYQAHRDGLTGVRNKHAYLDAEAKLNSQIREHTLSELAIVIMDINDLKKINDTAGHQAGDRYIRDACKFICDTFKHSPVFRVGGDEFTVVVQGDDLACIDELLETVRKHNEEASASGGVVVACGMARLENDACVASVYDRADQRMYENKSFLKSFKNT